MNAVIKTCKDKATELYHYAMKNPFSVYFLLFFKPIVDMLWDVAILDYALLAYAIAILAYNLIKRPDVFKRFRLMDYLCFAILFLMVLAFFRNTDGFRVFVKTASQFILFFIGRYCHEKTDKCITALRYSSFVVVGVNALVLFIGFFNGLGFQMWGGALTFSGTYYFKTDLALAMTQCLIFILFVKKLRWYNYTLAVLASVMIFLSNARISFVIAFMIFGLVFLYKISRFLKRRIRIFDLRLIATMGICVALAIASLFVLSKLPIAESLGHISLSVDNSQVQGDLPITDGGGNTVTDTDGDGTVDEEAESDEFTFATIKNKIVSLWLKVYTPANTQGRSTIWRYLVEDFSSRDLTSRLFGIDFVSDLYEVMPGFFADSHNAYLKTMYSIGILGLILFFAFLIIVILKLTYKSQNKIFFIVLQLMCVLLTVSFTTPACQTTQYTWVPMMFLGLLFRRDPQPHDEEESEPAPAKYIIDYIPVAKMSSFLSSVEFSIAMAIASCVIVIGKFQVGGVVTFVLIICAMLILCKDITVTTAPFLYLCVYACMKYDSFDVYIKLWWLAIPAVYALFYHFIKYRQPIVIGKSFWGILTVSVAVTLGGVGFIPASEYFNPIALYYTLGLGFGMLLCYVLIKSQIGNANGEMAKKRILTALYCMGLIASLCVFIQYIWSWDILLETGKVLENLTSRNNFSTFIIFALPIPFYFAIKNPYHLISAAVMFGANILTGSRGGMLFGTVELFICFAYLIWFTDSKKMRIIYASSVAALVAIALALLDPFLNFWNARYGGAGATFEENLKYDIRYEFLFGRKGYNEGSRVINNFLSNPLFGQGLGSTANLDIYNPKKGALCWYHMMTPQIVGSLGIAGILGYGYQLINRVWLSVKRINPFALALTVSWLGVFMMSQVNPGELCPLPYELLVVMMYIFIENEPMGARKAKKDAEIPAVAAENSVDTEEITVETAEAK
ncbi:MAG: O-antigen ligase family protein [Clostridia bacterium]|nr:O-antigen ligase family protein [Clostridia bacterium]